MSSNLDSKCPKTSLDAFSTIKGALLLNQVRDSAAHEHLLTATLHCSLPDTLGKLHNPPPPRPWSSSFFPCLPAPASPHCLTVCVYGPSASNFTKQDRRQSGSLKSDAECGPSYRIPWRIWSRPRGSAVEVSSARQ